MNGHKFHTKARAKNLSTQNCGVVVKGDVQSGEKDYYGILQKELLNWSMIVTIKLFYLSVTGLMYELKIWESNEKHMA